MVITLVGRQPPEKKTVNRDLPEKAGDTTQHRQSKEVAQHELGFDEPKKSRKLPDGAELRPKRLWGGRGGIRAQPPPFQNITDGVN